MLTLLTALPYADWFVRTLGEAAEQQRDVLYRARRATAVAIPVVVTRFRCPHCPASRAKKSAAEAHVARCWHNPAVRACKTCVHYEPAVPGGCWGDPYCNCPDTPESCALGIAVPMVTDCPQWQPDTTSLDTPAIPQHPLPAAEKPGTSDEQKGRQQ
ncbi:hypothetical protein AB0M58_13780 [Streptomyces bobili]|uniref:hypothetical protein n=1 Tax=Streptomyces bobili TaxID=67280 RepID=UPI003445FD3D